MMLCLAVFPPSANLMMYLMAYCASVVESVRSNDPKVLKFAEVCLHNVQKITTLGRQMETPSDEDIEKIQSGIIMYNLKSYQIWAATGSSYARPPIVTWSQTLYLDMTCCVWRFIH